MMVHPSANTTLNTTTSSSSSSNLRKLPDIGVLAQQQQRGDRPRPKGPGSRRLLPTPIVKNPAPPPTQPLPNPLPRPEPLASAVDPRSRNSVSDSLNLNESSKPRPIPTPDPVTLITTTRTSFVSNDTGVSPSSTSSTTINRGIRSLPSVGALNKRSSNADSGTNEIPDPARAMSTKLSRKATNPGPTNADPSTNSSPIKAPSRDPITTSMFTSPFSTSGPSKAASKRASTASAITAGIMADLDFNVDFNLDLNLVTLPPLKSTTAFSHSGSDTESDPTSDLDSESDEDSVSSPGAATTGTTTVTPDERPVVSHTRIVPRGPPMHVPNRSQSASPSAYAFSSASTSSPSVPAADSVTPPRRQSTSSSPSSSSSFTQNYKRVSNGRLNGARPPPVSMSGRRRTMTPTTPTSQGQFSRQQQQPKEEQQSEGAHVSQEQLVQTRTANQQHHPPVARMRTTSESAGTRPTGHGQGHGHSSSISSLNAMSKFTSNSTSVSPPAGVQTSSSSSKPSAHKLQSLQTVMSTATLTSTRRRSTLPQIPTATPGPIVTVQTAQQAQAPVLVSVQPRQKQQEIGRESPLQNVKPSSAPTTATAVAFGVNGGRASPAQSMTGSTSGFPALIRTESAGSVSRNAQIPAVSSSGRTSPAQPRIGVPVASVVVTAAIAATAGGNATTSAPSAFARIHPSMRTPWPVTSGAAVPSGQPAVSEPTGRVSSESSTSSLGSSSPTSPSVEEEEKEVEVSVEIHVKDKDKGKAREVSPASVAHSQGMVSQHPRYEEMSRSDDDSSDIIPVRMAHTRGPSPAAVGAGGLPRPKDAEKALPALPQMIVQRKKSKWKTATSATSTFSAKAASIASGLQNNISKKITGNLKAAIGTRRKAVPSIYDMPSELWSQIFMWCLPQPGPYSSSASPEEPLYIELNSACIPMILCQVNRTWRFTAISTPGLWSSLSLRLHGQANWLYFTQSWLERAADLPLSLHISWGPDKDLEAHDDVVQYLLFKANQWKHIRLSVSKEITVWQSHGFPSRVRKLLSKTMPNLESLEVATSLSSAISTIELQKVAPGLRNLRLMDSAIDPLKFVSASWEQLTGFQSAYVLEVPQALTILRRCPNMVNFDVCVGSSPLVEPTKTRKIIRPVQLKVLIVRETTPSAVDGFLRSLELPGIEELYIKAETWSIYEEYGWTTDELLHLLTRSKGRVEGARLRKLSVFNLEWDEGDIDGLVEEVPSVRIIEVKGRHSGLQVRVAE